MSKWSTITTEEAGEATKKLCTPEQIREAIKGLQELLYLNPGDDIKEYDARVQEAYKKFQIVHRANSAILDIAEKNGKPLKNERGEIMQTANGII